MTYHVVDPDDLEATPDRPCERRSIGEAVGLENVALNVYRPDPGETVPLAYHYHDEQEEAFVVLEGVLHVETPEREYVVEAGETFVAEAGAPHRAFVPEDAAASAELLAVGAPAVDDANVYEGE